MRVRVIVPVAVRVPVVIIVAVLVAMAVAVLMSVLVIMSVLIFLIGPVIVIGPVSMLVRVIVIVLRAHHGLPSAALAFGSLRMRWAAIAAPKPLSMLTTTTPEAQLVSMAKSAVKPPSAVP